MSYDVFQDALNFSGRKVLVIGGSSGIGNSIAQAFRRRGALTHIWGTKPSAASYTETRGSDFEGLHYQAVDVRDPKAVTAAASAFDRLDAVIMSQGAVIYGRGEFEPAGFSQVVDINLNSLMTCAAALQPALAEAGGALIVISSTGAYRATKGNPAYSASKAGTLGLVRSLGEAWAGQGIRVNAIAPGLTETKMTKVSTEKPERLARMLAEIPLGRLGQPEDIAGVALFLASPLASYIIGQTLVVDGGSLLS